MSVWINSQRKTVVLGFDEVTGETFTIRATNMNDDKAHSSGPHDLELNEAGQGTFIETFPNGFSGDVLVEITGSDGSRTEDTIPVA